MDPLSHVLFGRALGDVLPGRRPGTTAALVLGSLCPDSDIVLVSRFDRYLTVHTWVTHTLVSSVIEALLVALVLRFVIRGNRFWTVTAAAWVGVVGHVFWDLASGSDIKLLAPLSRESYGWHLVTMGEPFVVVLLIAGAVAVWRWPARGRQFAFGTLMVLAVALSSKAITQRLARARYQAVAVPLDRQSAEMVPLRNHLFEWTVFDRLPAGGGGAWRVNAKTGDAVLLFARTNAPESPAVEASKALPCVRTLM